MFSFRRQDAEITASVTGALVYVTLVNKTAFLPFIHSHMDLQNMQGFIFESAFTA